jgi:ATP-dependent DNA ligase
VPVGQVVPQVPVGQRSRPLPDRRDRLGRAPDPRPDRSAGPFPEIVTALGELDVDVVLDGKLVLCREGRVDFAALQRSHPAESRTRELSLAMPASCVVFDVPAVDGTDVRPKPHSTRRALL